MKSIQKKCVKLEKHKKRLEEEVDRLRSHMEKHMVEHSQVQQYQREVEERARQDLVEKLKQVNLFLQVRSVPVAHAVGLAADGPWLRASQGVIALVCFLGV